MNHLEALSKLDTLDGYIKNFMDPVFWAPYIKQAVSAFDKHLDPEVRIGIAGTYPTFIVNDLWVVKFFGRLFNGRTAFLVEKTVTELVTSHMPLPSPRIVYEGELYPGFNPPWSFLIYEYIPGISISSVLNEMSLKEKLRLAGWLGSGTRRLHEIQLDSDAHQALPAQDELLDTTISNCIQRHLEWGTLPSPLIAQIGPFLEETSQIDFNPIPHHLIHADITGDHILGTHEGRVWKTNAVIDFGDAMIGSLEYELVPIHLDIFRWNKVLLSEFIEAYGKDLLRIDLLPLAGIRGMLLHQFNVISILESDRMVFEGCSSLFQLAERLWKI